MATKTTKQPSFKEIIDELSKTIDIVALSTESDAQTDILAGLLEEKLEVLNDRT